MIKLLSFLYLYIVRENLGAQRILPLDEDEALELGLTLVEEKNEVEVKEVLNYLSGLAVRYTKEGQEEDTKRLIEYVKKIGKAAAATRMEGAVVSSILLYPRLAREVCRQQMEDALVSIALALGEIGRAAANQRMEISAKIAASCLGEMGNTTAFTKKETIAIIFALGEIGKSVMSYNLGDMANNKIALFEKNAANQNFEKAVLNSKNSIWEIVTETMEEDLDNNVDDIKAFDSIVKAAESKEFNRAMLKAAYSLETIKFNAEERCLMGASIIAEVALLNLERFKISEEKTIRTSREKKKFLNINS